MHENPPKLPPGIIEDMPPDEESRYGRDLGTSAKVTWSWLKSKFGKMPPREDYQGEVYDGKWGRLYIDVRPFDVNGQWLDNLSQEFTSSGLKDAQRYGFELMRDVPEVQGFWLAAKLDKYWVNEGSFGTKSVMDLGRYERAPLSPKEQALADANARGHQMSQWGGGPLQDRAACMKCGDEMHWVDSAWGKGRADGRASYDRKCSGDASGHIPNARIKLEPGQYLETRGVLGGAYRGRDLSDRALLTHAVIMQGEPPGDEVRVLCSQPLDNIIDYYGATEAEHRAPPTCPRCLERWQRLQLHPNPRKRGPAMQLGAADDAANRQREASGGRFTRSPACDFCGKSCAAEHFTDDRADPGGDGPGFYLCGRVACARARERLEAAEGFEALKRAYAEQRRKNDVRRPAAGAFLDGPPGTARELKDLRRQQAVVEQMLRYNTDPEKIASLQRKERDLQERVDKLAFPEHTPNATDSEYRGLRIEVIDNATQLGYRTGEGMRSRPGKGRNIGRQYLIHLGEAGSGGTKMVSTMRAAREYIDDYLGPEHTPNARRPDNTYLVLDLGDGLVATRLKAERSKTLGGSMLETWKVHPSDEPGRPVAQIQIFQNKDFSWSSWSVMPRDRVYGKALADARNATRLTPNASVYNLMQLDEDVGAALEHMNDAYDLALSADQVSVTSPFMVALRDLGEYDDVTGWLELDSSADTEELERFRGSEWRRRASRWSSPQQMPPIVIVQTRAASAIADGRGRVNYAYAMGWSEIPAVIVEPHSDAPKHTPNAKLALVDPRPDDKITRFLKATKLRAARGTDFESAIIAAGNYASKQGVACYVYKGNSFGHEVFRATPKKSDLNPINNSGRVVYGVTPDLQVTLYTVAREELEPNASYYVWVLNHDDTPKDEGPYGPKDLESAKTFARIAATSGAHDRAVSRGLDPRSPSFEIVRRYEHGTGERLQ